APRAGPVGGRSVVCMRSASSAAVTGGGATLGARSPPAQPGAPQSTDDQRVVGRGRRVVEQGAQQLVVAGGRHVEALADRGCLRRRKEPPSPLEVEDRPVTIGECHWCKAGPTDHA